MPSSSALRLHEGTESNSSPLLLHRSCVGLRDIATALAARRLQTSRARTARHAKSCGAVISDLQNLQRRIYSAPPEFTLKSSKPPFAKIASTRAFCTLAPRVPPRTAPRLRSLHALECHRSPPRSSRGSRLQMHRYNRAASLRRTTVVTREICASGKRTKILFAFAARRARLQPPAFVEPTAVVAPAKGPAGGASIT